MIVFEPGDAAQQRRLAAARGPTKTMNSPDLMSRLTSFEYLDVAVALVEIGDPQTPTWRFLPWAYAPGRHANVGRRTASGLNRPSDRFVVNYPVPRRASGRARRNGRSITARSRHVEWKQSSARPPPSRTNDQHAVGRVERLDLALAPAPGAACGRPASPGSAAARDRWIVDLQVHRLALM